MPHKGRLGADEKIAIVERYLAGKEGFSSILQSKKIGKGILSLWIRLYKTRGPEGLVSSGKNRQYSLETKLQVIREYLGGKASLNKLCEEYNISSHSMVQQWIKKYNNHEEFKTPNSGGKICMVKGRTTTLEERIEIVQYCIKNGKDYGKATEHYEISYQQIYNWVKKYEVNGINGLEDHRGKGKNESSMTEIEHLQAENRLLMAKLKEAELRNLILKKVRAIERGRR